MTTPKPLRMPTPPQPVRIGQHEGTELPGPPTWSYREVKPRHVAGSFAVYELHPGEYTVTRHGEASEEPFVTSDSDLAVLVCDRWAREFPAGP